MFHPFPSFPPGGFLMPPRYIAMYFIKPKRLRASRAPSLAPDVLLPPLSFTAKSFQQSTVRGGMANFRYFRTFIDEDSSIKTAMLSRSPSCPAFGTNQNTEEEEQLGAYVASLSVRSEAEMQAVVQEMRARPAEESADQPSGETKHTIEPTAAAMLPGALNKGSRGHPFLCKRPCVRMAKGICNMGNACEYCHHDAHGPTASPNKGQLRQLKSMDSCWCLEKASVSITLIIQIALWFLVFAHAM